MTVSARRAGPSPLELLHPAGSVDRVLVSGERCPEWLVPPTAERAGTDVGLALIAPSGRQLARRGWLAGTLADATRALGPDGLVCAVLPPPTRSLARRRLASAGLEMETALAQLPLREPRYLLPISEAPWRHMLTREIGAHPRVRRVLRAADSLPGGTALLGSWLPGAALIGRRRGGAPLADWPHRLDGETRPTTHVAIQTSWRGAGGPLVLFCFVRGAQGPWGIAKVGAGSEREARSLEQLGPSASEAGAVVPRLLARGMAGAHPVLVESALRGQPAARALAGARARFANTAGQVATWLERWNAETARRAPLPADFLAPLLSRLELPAAYRDWLGEKSAALAGSALPLVAAHHDLTMWNVRLGDDGALEILDWAESERDALPLCDLFYAVADAAAASEGYRDRVSAVRGCFELGGARRPVVGPLVERGRDALGLSPDAAELCFHACWLRHAGNERAAGGGDGSFAEIVRWLAHRAEVS